MNLSELGKRIKNLREKNRLTQAQLANSLQITAQAVSKWERGENAPDISMLIPLAEIFGISIEQILTGYKNIKNTFNATVMCTSLRNFAKKSSTTSPGDIALWINGIFHILTESVLSFGGVPIKYVGDGFLAYFSERDHSQRAFDAAKKAHKSIQNKNLLITLNRGNVYLGAIGHHEFSSPDIMGDTVNTTFFMNQWATVNSDSNLIISDKMFKSLQIEDDAILVPNEKNNFSNDIYELTIHYN